MQEQPGDNWTTYNIEVLYTANNYNEARRKLPLAEQQTDLQSEAENESLKPHKRKIQPNKRLLEDGYNTDEETLPQHQAAQSVWQQEATPGSSKETPQLQKLRSASVCEQKFATLLHDLLTKQEVIIEQQRNLIRMVQDLKTTSTRENAVDCDLDQRHCPVEDLSSLMALENDLRSSPDKRKKLTGFQSLELKSVVTEAVRRNSLCANATEMEVERVIRRWFHLAGDREGGRKRRKEIAEDMESNTSGKNNI
ncbi:hypothetical protein AMEX_G12454 [Astyanax mexicanus]|uniref:Uncharacterized protein n=1 Tax=Astyanax mexicanus TaxID=7994 RepID=A0A8T2LME7_ASTMX|nr:hypothetical protein AMEX_G12454 [Astyanax mexicanus]